MCDKLPRLQRRDTSTLVYYLLVRILLAMSQHVLTKLYLVKILSNLDFVKKSLMTNTLAFQTLILVTKAKHITELTCWRPDI